MVSNLLNKTYPFNRFEMARLCSIIFPATATTKAKYTVTTTEFNTKETQSSSSEYFSTKQSEISTEMVCSEAIHMVNKTDEVHIGTICQPYDTMLREKSYEAGVSKDKFAIYMKYAGR